MAAAKKAAVASAVVFPPIYRIVLGLVVGFLAYLTMGTLDVSEELRGAITALTVLLGSAGVVPPKPGDLPTFPPRLSFALTALVTGVTYVISIVNMDGTLRGIIAAVIATAASVGIVPPSGAFTKRS